MDEQRLRDVEYWSTADVLSYQAQAIPDKVALEFIGGESYSYKDIWQRAKAIASGLKTQGVQPGDKIGVLLTNRMEYCEIWWGCHLAGGVLVPINTELLGSLLSHTVNLSEVSLLVVEQDLLPRLENIAETIPALKTVVLVSDGGTVDDDMPWRTISFESLRGNPADAPAPVAKFSDLACLMFTSGTTGPSKAVMMPHGHCYLFGLSTMDNLDFGSEDTYYVTLPMFHVNAMLMQIYGSLIAGAKAVIRKKFSATNWIGDIARYNATHTNFLGVMAEFIYQVAPTDQDKNHKLRVICAAPAAPVYVERFKEKYAVPGMVEGYGMSEINVPLMQPLDAPRPHSCGKIYERYFDVRIADPETDQPVPPDTRGEFQIRPKQAFGFMSGYYNAPEKTMEAWRNLWFHTGDAGRMDSDGYFYFIDRLKDSIRRRGENISAFEVETVILDFPAVKDCAVIAVSSEFDGGEDEVMAVSVIEGTLDPQDLLDYCKQNLPKFAVPGYFRFVSKEDMPRTSTNKVIKQRLRETGISDDTWRAPHEERRKAQ